MIKELLILCVLSAGTAFAQETEIERPPSPLKVETLEETPPPPPPVLRAQQQEPVSVAEIVDFPDEEAEFPGGVEAMKKFIQDNVVYPEISARKGDEGRVYVVFIVERDGSTSGVEVMRGGQTAELNAEAIRLVQSMPAWSPGKVKGENVRARCRLPITFILTSGEDEKK